MPQRYAQPSVGGPSDTPEPPLRIAAAMREVIAEGYGVAAFRRDVLAGLVVGVVALPLSMALAISSGVPPQHGLYTAIVAGLLSALLGGSRTLVSGPTAAFVVILAPISARYGVGGLLLATMMAGAMLAGLGLMRMGRLIQFIPHPVTTGFTAGIAVVIATLQLKDFFGLTLASSPEHYVERVQALVAAAPTVRPTDFVVGATTLAVLLLWPRVTSRVPAPLVALVGAGVTTWALGLDVATLGSRFSWTDAAGTHPGIPPLPPTPVLPWTLGGAGGAPFDLGFGTIRQLFPAATAIATLGAIESLLSAVVADGMAGTRHDPDAELVGQGVANMVSPFFGGFASTGAIARSATNIRAGGRSPVAAVVHAVFVLLAMIVLAPALSWLPMASLAALLLLVAWNMSEVRHFTHIARVAPRSDVTVLVVCFSLTVLFDMTIAVTTGVILAAFLFMRRMVEISGARVSEGSHPALRDPLPPGVLLYEVAGPLFFGAAQKAMAAVDHIGEHTRVVILDLSAVPAMDATGLVALESALSRLREHGVFVILSGILPQPAKVLEKGGLRESEHLALSTGLQTAVARARARVARH